MPVTVAHASTGTLSAGCVEFSGAPRPVEDAVTVLDGTRHAGVRRVDVEWRITLTGIDSGDIADWHDLRQIGSAELVSINPGGIPGAPSGAFAGYVMALSASRVASLSGRWRVNLTVLQPGV